MIRPLISLVFVALAWFAAADLREPPVSEAERAAFAAACDYYQERAGREAPVPADEFAAFLAEVCARARVLLESGTPEQGLRSALLLDRITGLRRTVAAINATRAMGSASGYVPVSPSGEFLIAHRMGVFLAFDAWLDTGVEFSVASYP